MKIKIEKKIRCLLFSAVVLFMFSHSVYAKEITSHATENAIKMNHDSCEGELLLVPGDLKKIGSIQIELEDTEKKQSKAGVKLGLIRIADVLDGEFVLLDEFEMLDINLNQIQNANELELVAKKIISRVGGVETTVVTDKNGKALVTELEIGVYLMFVLDSAQYENITPFLVSIPIWNEIEQDMTYDIVVRPKHTSFLDVETPEILPTGIEERTFVYGMISGILFVIWGLIQGRLGNNKNAIS